MIEQYKDAISEIENQVRGEDGKFSRHILPAEGDTVILWGLFRGWSSVVIGHKIKRSSHTFRQVVQQFHLEPALMFRLPVLHQRYKNRDRLFTCAFCGREMLNVRERAAREHLASHILPEQLISGAGQLCKGGTHA